MASGNQKPVSILAGISRSLLGVVFIFSGVVKAIDPLGTVYKIEDYLKAFGGFFTDLLPAAEIAAWGLIILELLLGVCMLLNVCTQWTSWISLLFCHQYMRPGDRISRIQRRNFRDKSLLYPPEYAILRKKEVAP